MAEIMAPYEYDGRKFEGAVVWDDSVSTPRPMIFMQPDWFGVCRHTIDMAAEAAGKDYVMLVADMYGVGYGERDKEFDELLASAQGARHDLPLVREGAAIALHELLAVARAQAPVSDSPLGAIGFCMGGGIVLEQARAGADFAGTVIFHVTLPNPVEEKATTDFKGRVLAIHGRADPVTPKEMMDALETELTTAGVDWQTMTFGNATHAFCVRGENNPPMTLFDEELCQKSYGMMHEFFSETL
ncbi:MAG: dienelactone hydrolase family protein [Rhodospirillaceae bacterium]|nr:dienelactone hydrolase family protein [Rhodospirillaceae bacterium]MBT5943283.1 dienelactone hydrolase family protein [Rhodospirillaceae bacterium]